MLASTANTSFIAAWLAAPPIQLPAIVVMPRQVPPAPVDGWIKPTAAHATTAPRLTPTAPLSNMLTALVPRLTTAPLYMALHTRNTTADTGSSQALCVSLNEHLH